MVCLPEIKRQPGVEEQPHLLGKHFNFPGNVLQTTGTENSPFKIAFSIHAQVIETTDEAIVDACIKFAHAAGISDLYLLDRDLVKEALLEKAAKIKAETDKPLHWIDYDGYIICPVCRYDCNDEYALGKGNFCPDCGTRLLPSRRLLEAQE
jgi:hypothetical protein